ncbi:TPA: hypothetical protein SID16_002095 [Pasteurella multocida]|nr:hypothetical protein [Pasteurella multocida]
MKQIVLKTSLLMTLSSLLVACSGGGGSAGNRADRVEEKAQPVQSNSGLLPLQSKILLIPLRMILFMTNFQCLLMTHPKKIVNNPPLKPL